MQQITLDLNSIGYEPIYAGEIGESRAVRLYLIPPSYMADDTNITKYNVAFKVAAGVVLSEFFTQSDDIIIDLGAPLTEESTLLFQLIGMSADGETVISKTPTIRLIIGDSIEGEVIPDPATGKTIYAEISELDARVTALEEGGTGGTQSDWNETDPEEPSYIKNKPTIPTKTSDLVNDSDFTEIIEVVSYNPMSGWGTPQYTGAQIHSMFTSGQLVKIRGNLILHTEMDGNTVHASYWNGASQFSIIGIDDSKQYVTVPFVRKYLTEEDYSLTEKNKLATIAQGAEVNVQSDWNESNSSSDAFIKNKPTIPTKTSDLTNNSGFITSADVPTKTSDLENDSGFLTDIEWTEIYDQTKEELLYTGDGLCLMYLRNVPMVFTEGGIKRFITYVEKSSNTVTIRCYTTGGVNRLTIATATVADDSKAISQWAVGSMTISSADAGKLSGGEVAQNNTKFVTGGQVYDAVSAKQDTLTAGTNITISNNVISATGGASSADAVSYDNTDSGLTATNVQDAIDEVVTDKQNKLTAGSNITIQNDVISASGSLPSAQTELDVLYWHNGAWTTGAITNVIPDGDNLSY